MYEDDDARTLIDFDWARIPLSADVVPERSIQIAATLPAILERGTYLVVFDLVIEGVTWFEARGSMPLQVRIDVG